MYPYALIDRLLQATSISSGVVSFAAWLCCYYDAQYVSAQLILLFIGIYYNTILIQDLGSIAIYSVTFIGRLVYRPRYDLLDYLFRMILSFL
jgi:hypothetical protein